MDTSDEKMPQEVVVKKVGTDGAELAVFEFQGELRDLMVSSFRQGFLTTGSYLPNAKAISPQGAASVAYAGTSMSTLALSAATAPTLYMATANPATLMQIGNGLGSAVMGSSGIVAHAPFIPVASTLPVLAPILVMQALNTAVMMQQFKQVDQKLDDIKRTLNEAIARVEATHVGELIAASSIVDDVYRQYGHEGTFSNDMLLRLGLAERDVRGLTARFRQLVDARETTDVKDLADVQRSNYDAHSAMLASFLDLRIAYLRVCVDLQEHPRSLDSSIEHLKGRIDDGIAFWERMLTRSEVLKEQIDTLDAKLLEMNWAKRNLPRFAGGEGTATTQELERLKAAYTNTMESERKIMSGFYSLIDSAKSTRSALDRPTEQSEFKPTLVYWRDEEGEHSFVTEQNLLT